MITIDDFNPVQTTPFSFKLKLKSKIWQSINKTIYRLPIPRGKIFRIYLVNLFGGQISPSCNLHRLSVIDFPWNLKMGHLSSIGERSWIYCYNNIIIGEKSCVGKDVYLLTGSHFVDSLAFDYDLRPIIIGDGVWVSTGVYVLPGVTISDFSVIGANSTVTKDIGENLIVAGNPARVIKKRFNK